MSDPADKVGRWLSAALEDPQVCVEMKRDILEWMEAGQPALRKQRERIMDKEEALELIDHHKNQLVHPVEMLQWTWLRVIVMAATDEEWQGMNERAARVLSQ